MGWNKALTVVTAAVMACTLIGASLGDVAYGEPDSSADAFAAVDQPEAAQELSEDASVEATDFDEPQEPEEASQDATEVVSLEAQDSPIDIMNCDYEDIWGVYYWHDPVTPKPVITYNGETLEEGVDYTLSYENNDGPTDEARVIVTGMGRFWSDLVITFRIDRPSIWNCTVSKIPDQKWEGKPLYPKPVVTYEGVVLKEGVDYTISYADNDTPEFGEGYVILKGIGDFASEDAERWVPFNIVGAKDLSFGEAGCGRMKWTGKPLTPKMKVTYEGKTLKEGRDYEVLQYKNNVDCGIATVIVVGKGSYWNTLEGGFVIEGEQLRFATVSPIPDQKWTGKEVKPKPKVTYNGKVLIEGVDYVLTYENNINPCVEATGPSDENAAFVTISGKGQYTGNLVYSFAICRAGTWKQTNGRWWYRYPDGSYPKNCDRTIDGKRYCFDKNGYMVTGWQRRMERWVYFKASGAMAYGWMKMNGSWYYFEPYYGYMCVGLVSIGADDYVFDQRSGVMLTGWQKPLGNMWYYLKPSGAAVKGWNKIGGTWYYFDYGVMSTGWKKISGTWYYFKSSGAMVTGWQKISGKYYYFESNGAMAKSKWVGGYYVQSNGVMAANTWIGRYHVNANGKWDKTR